MLSKAIKRFKKIVTVNPLNFLQRYYLIKAKSFALKEKRASAEAFYPKAIACAKERHHLLNTTLAYELAARFLPPQHPKKSLANTSCAKSILSIMTPLVFTKNQRPYQTLQRAPRRRTTPSPHSKDFITASCFLAPAKPHFPPSSPNS